MKALAIALLMILAGCGRETDRIIGAQNERIKLLESDISQLKDVVSALSRNAQNDDLILKNYDKRISLTEEIGPIAFSTRERLEDTRRIVAKIAELHTEENKLSEDLFLKKIQEYDGRIKYLDNRCDALAERMWRIDSPFKGLERTR